MNIFKRWRNQSNPAKKTNLVIASWGGERRNEKPEYLKKVPCGDTMHLVKQLAALERYTHNLSQVTITCPPCPNPSPEYLNIIKSMPPRLKNGTEIKILYTPSNSYSYSSWQFAVQTYRRQFQYYLFIEDDYIFVENNFDQILIEMYEEKQKTGCEYMLSFTEIKQSDWQNKKIPQGAVVTNGIISSKTLNKKGYSFPTDMGSFLVHFKHEMFSEEFGFSPYFCNKGIVYFGKGKSLLVPSQMVDLYGRVCEPTNPIIYTEIVEQLRRDGKSSGEFLNSLH